MTVIEIAAEQVTKVVTLDRIQAAAARELAGVRAKIADLEKQNKEMTELFKSLLPDADSAVDPATGEVLLTFTARDGQRSTDYEKLMALHPSVYAQVVSKKPDARVMHVNRERS